LANTILTYSISLLLLACSPVSNVEPNISAGTIAQIESQILRRGLPGEADTCDFNAYKRFYARRQINGHPMIQAHYIGCDRALWLPESAQGVAGIRNAFVVDEHDLPSLVDGGCNQLTIVFDPAAGQLTPVRQGSTSKEAPEWVVCNGRA